MRIIFVLFILFFSSFSIAFSKSYDFYVDEDCGSNPDGSKDKPFCKIEDALDEAGKNKQIYIKNGEYKEDLDIQDGIELFGESESGVVIKGNLQMDDDSAIEKLTVSGANINVNIKKGADVEIDNCTIKEAVKVGIQTEAGGGKLEVKNSKIRDNRKGFYIQKGKSIEITNNEIYDNKEEGVDIRGDVSGSIFNNLIQKNSESGIELIIGKSNLSIKSNSIKKNGASGIANQFYSQWDKKGTILISNNTLFDNKKFGIDCNRPSGGDAGESYWKESIELKDNKIEENKKGSINKVCSLKKEDEIAENETENQEQEAQTENQEQVQSKNKIEENKKEDELSEIDLKIQNRLKIVEEEKKNEKLKVENAILKINKDGYWKIFFLGYNPKEVENLKESFQKNQDYIKEVESFSEKTGNPKLVEKSDFLKNDISKDNSNLEKAIQKIDDNFSLFGWVRKIIYKIT